MSIMVVTPCLYQLNLNGAGNRADVGFGADYKKLLFITMISPSLILGDVQI